MKLIFVSKPEENVLLRVHHLWTIYASCRHHWKLNANRVKYGILLDIKIMVKLQQYAAHCSKW